MRMIRKRQCILLQSGVAAEVRFFNKLFGIYARRSHRLFATEPPERSGGATKLAGARVNRNLCESITWSRNTKGWLVCSKPCIGGTRNRAHGSLKREYINEHLFPRSTDRGLIEAPPSSTVKNWRTRLAAAAVGAKREVSPESLMFCSERSHRSAHECGLSFRSE